MLATAHAARNASSSESEPFQILKERFEIQSFEII